MPDRLATTTDVLADVGYQFRNVLYTALRSLPREGRQARRTYIRNGRTVGFWAPTYSRQLMYKALAERVSSLAGSGRMRQFGEPVTTADREVTADRRQSQPFHRCPGRWTIRHRLPVEPYTLGAWLGDGHSDTARITCADEEILDGIRADGYAVTKPAALYGIWEIRSARRGMALERGSSRACES